MTTTVLLPGARALAAAAGPELPQKDDLCGPFWALATLRALGESASGTEEVALAAGTHLWAGTPSALPPGQPERRDYDRALPVSADAERAGTDVGGVVGALETLSAGRLRAEMHTTDDWGPGGVATLLEGLAEQTAPLAVIANVATEQYLLPAAADAAQRFLRTGALSGYEPSAWSAGHFVAVLGWQEGPGGRLYRLHDGYPQAGAFVHEQPAGAFAAALRRPGRSAGSLVVVRRAGATPR
ncbi:MAG: DUF6885 family protein [Cellulomonadaceae bacterium]